MGSNPLTRRVDFVAGLHGGGNRPCARTSSEIPHVCGVQIRNWIAAAVLLFLPLINSLAADRPDLCELPIEGLMQIEFNPAAGAQTPVLSDDASVATADGTLSAEATQLVPGLLPAVARVHSLPLPGSWGWDLPCFWMVVWEGSKLETLIGNDPPDDLEARVK